MITKYFQNALKLFENINTALLSQILCIYRLVNNPYLSASQLYSAIVQVIDTQCFRRYLNT